MDAEAARARDGLNHPFLRARAVGGELLNVRAGVRLAGRDVEHLAGALVGDGRVAVCVVGDGPLLRRRAVGGIELDVRAVPAGTARDVNHLAAAQRAHDVVGSCGQGIARRGREQVDFGRLLGGFGIGKRPGLGSGVVAGIQLDGRAVGVHRAGDVERERCIEGRDEHEALALCDGDPALRPGAIGVAELDASAGSFRRRGVVGGYGEHLAVRHAGDGEVALRVVRDGPESILTRHVLLELGNSIFPCDEEAASLKAAHQRIRAVGKRRGVKIGKLIELLACGVGGNFLRVVFELLRRGLGHSGVRAVLVGLRGVLPE